MYFLICLKLLRCIRVCIGISRRIHWEAFALLHTCVPLHTCARMLCLFHLSYVPRRFVYLINRVCVFSGVNPPLAISLRISPICSFRGRGCRIIEVHFPIVLASIHAVLVAARRSFAAVVCAIHSFNVA